MNKVLRLISVLILTVTISGCESKKREKIDIETVELSDKVFTDSEIARHTISAIMNQPLEIMNVRNNEGIYNVSYTRKDDKKKFEYKIKIKGNNVIWGNSDGRWRDSQFDEKIEYSETNNELIIVQKFTDGSETIKKFTKEE